MRRFEANAARLARLPALRAASPARTGKQAGHPFSDQSTMSSDQATAQAVDQNWESHRVIGPL